jgi:hypothetical protein
MLTLITAAGRENSADNNDLAELRNKDIEGTAVGRTVG